eukprot:jgi/Picsp_1/1520/NSC_04998-R1_c transferase
MTKGGVESAHWPLRLLMVSDFFHPNIGGVESHIYQLSQQLMRKGHRVVIYTHAYKTENETYCGVVYLTNGLKVYYVPRKTVYQAATLPTIFGGFGALRKVIVSERINLVHAHQAFSAMANEAVIHARTMKIPTVFTDHSLFGFADASSILMNKALKFSLADVQKVICVSHTSRENTVLRACIPPARVHVVPNAVEIGSFYPVRHDTIASLREADRTVVVMSRLVYRKGIDLLSYIIPILAKKHRALRFVIGGDGPKRAELEGAVKEAKLEKRVDFVGALPHSKVLDLLKRGSIFLNCSLTEAFCVSLVEAAAAGLLVVSTSVGGVPEVLPEEMMILADASPAGLIQAVDAALERINNLNKELKNESPEIWPQARFEKAQAQHDAVSRMYSWSVVATKTEHVYRGAMANNTGFIQRIKRYSLCGKWFGKICCFIAAMDWLILLILQIMQPSKSITQACDFPQPY